MMDRTIERLTRMPAGPLRDRAAAVLGERRRAVRDAYAEWHKARRAERCAWIAYLEARARDRAPMRGARGGPSMPHVRFLTERC